MARRRPGAALLLGAAAALCLLLSPPVAPGSRAVSLNSRQEPEVVIGEVKYDVSPAIPNVQQLANQGQDRAGEALSAAAEVHAAEARQNAADAALFSNRKMREVIRADARSSRAYRIAKHAAFDALKASEQADAAVAKIKALFHRVDDVTHEAAARAVREVVAKRKQMLGKQATAVKKEVAKQEQRLTQAAGVKAQEMAYPFQQAKIKAEKNVIDYLLRARELVAAVTQMKNQSVKIAVTATQLQAKGLLIPAQQKMMEAHDLMDKAKQLEGQATAFTNLANQINGEMGLYDLAAGGAANYGGYQKNPGGPDFSMPPLPKAVGGYE